MLIPGVSGLDLPLALALALLMEMAAGERAWRMTHLPRLPVLAARAMGWLDAKLNRIERSDADRKNRGRAAWLMAACLWISAGLGVALLIRLMSGGRFSVISLVEVLLVARAVSIRKPLTTLLSLPRLLHEAQSEQARRTLAPLTDDDVRALDGHGMARTAAEAVLEGLARDLAAPCLFYILLGLPGLGFWAACEGASRAVGHDTPRYHFFGAAARWGTGLVRLPGRWLACLALVAAGLALFPRRAGALVRAVPSLQPLHLGAAALDLCLGGPKMRGGRMVRLPWIGDGRARARPRDVKACFALYLLAAIVTVGLCALIGLAGSLPLL
jgi:adenosylcobinamide-phosphate synthase